MFDVSVLNVSLSDTVHISVSNINMARIDFVYPKKNS